MSCWVAPAVAAEMWHCGIEQVLEAVRNGSIPSRIEGGFLLVEVALGSLPDAEPVKSTRRYITESDDTDPVIAPPPISAPPPPRAGEEIVTRQEMAALEGRTYIWDSNSEDSEEDEEAIATATGESSKYDMSQWRQIRTATSRLRRPPR
jgi:hypothetical protein